MEHIKLSQMIEKMNLTILNPSDVFVDWEIWHKEVNRPAFQLAGFFEEFPYERVQIIGNEEVNFLNKLSRERKLEIYSELLKYDMPCVVFCRSLEPDEDFMRIATENKRPILQTSMATALFMSDLIAWLSRVTSPRVKTHGTLIDVYGEGVLITGESGMGKSEAAMELLRRGHRLVADDVVQIHRVNDNTLVGKAPELTKHFIELRGIGIVDVRNMFGVQCVKETQEISFVIYLEEWDRNKSYERFGMSEEYTEYLGVKLVKNTIPVRPGRNLAVIVESAAVNFRQKQMGYNAADELNRRMQSAMKNR